MVYRLTNIPEELRIIWKLQMLNSSSQENLIPQCPQSFFFTNPSLNTRHSIRGAGAKRLMETFGGGTPSFLNDVYTPLEYKSGFCLMNFLRNRISCLVTWKLMHKLEDLLTLWWLFNDLQTSKFKNIK